jgi:hypothetical protein
MYCTDTERCFIADRIQIQAIRKPDTTRSDPDISDGNLGGVLVSAAFYPVVKNKKNTDS